jgi:hypothetical protein
MRESAPSGPSGSRVGILPLPRAVRNPSVCSRVTAAKLSSAGSICVSHITKAAQRELELGDGGGAIGQPARGEPAVDGGLHPRRDGRAIGVAGHQLARLRGELPAVKADDLELVDVRGPVLRAAAVALARAVKEVAVGAIIEAPHRLQQLIDVLIGDRRRRRVTRVQEDPAERPAQPLLRSAALEPEPDGVLDESLQAT